MFINIEKTKEEKLVDLAREISAQGDMAMGSLINSHKTVYDLIWNNSEFTPQEILDVFGSNASKLYQVSVATQQFIQAINPEYVPLEYPDLTVNEDGTITIIHNDITNE